MATFRVNKTDDYTVMSNHHLKEKEMSLKAKGLLCLMLSLPDDWDYSIDGLVSMCKENKTAVLTTLKELKERSYLSISEFRNNKGQFEYIYDIFEMPNIEKPNTENPHTDKPNTENQPLLNTDILNTNKKENNTTYLKEKKTYGEFNNVFLTDDEYEKLKTKFKDYEERIQRLSQYIASKGKKYKSHYATILTWDNKDKTSSASSNRKVSKDSDWLPDYIDHFEDDVQDL